MILMPVGFLKDIVNMLAGTIHQCRRVSSDAFGLQVGMQGTIKIVSKRSKSNGQRLNRNGFLSFRYGRRTRVDYIRENRLGH